VMRREEKNAVRVFMKTNGERKKWREIPQKRWFDTIEIDTKAVGVCVGDVENLDKWRLRTKFADLK
jgi:hypothetical protein